MNQVIIWCWTYNGGENLYRGDCFENALLEELKKSKEYFADDEKFKLLFAKLEELKSTESPQDILYTLFLDNVTMDFEFAKQLKFYDVISADCFCSETDVGNALIYLMEYAAFSFVVYFKKWESTNQISFDFVVTHEDNEKEVYLSLTKGEK